MFVRREAQAQGLRGRDGCRVTMMQERDDVCLWEVDLPAVRPAARRGVVVVFNANLAIASQPQDATDTQPLFLFSQSLL